MKVAIIADGISPEVIGGMQKHSFYIAKYLALKGVEVELHTIVYNEADKSRPFPFDENELKVLRVFRYVFPRSIKFPGHYLYNSYRASKMIRERIDKRLNDFDFVYTKGFMGWSILKQRQKYPDTIIGVKFHGMNMFLPTSGWKQKLEQLLLKPPTRWIMRNADVVFSYGGKVTDTIVRDGGIDPSRVRELRTGIETAWVRNWIKETKGPKKVLYVGRYDPVKGIRELSDCLLEERFERLEFTFVGPIPEEKRLKLKGVHYLGEISNVEKLQDIFDQSDILILPSYSEGMPNVVIEAMARGLVILATDVGAVNVLVNKQNGVLLNETSKVQIASSLRIISKLSNQELSEMKKASIERIKNAFLWETIADELVELIQQEILGKN